MDPATRLRLEEYFEPHNRRLYEYLGVDFGWHPRTIGSVPTSSSLIRPGRFRAQ